ncbi:MAG: hypothetical protein HQL06_12265 [Nitrospirae bacterium]|nr:hypothetical protein [Nitrospirota bacterium]
MHKKLMGRPVIAVLDTAIHKLIDSCFRRNDIFPHDFLMHPWIDSCFRTYAVT